jgi:hypothetical protein
VPEPVPYAPLSGAHTPPATSHPSDRHSPHWVTAPLALEALAVPQLDRLLPRAAPAPWDSLSRCFRTRHAAAKPLVNAVHGGAGINRGCGNCVRGLIFLISRSIASWVGCSTGFFVGGGGWDRPEAACPPDCRPIVGEAGGFNAVQKLLTNPASSSLVSSRAPLAGSTPGRSSPRRDDTLVVSRTMFRKWQRRSPPTIRVRVDGQGTRPLEHQLGRHAVAVIAVSGNLASCFEVELD